MFNPIKLIKDIVVWEYNTVDEAIWLGRFYLEIYFQKDEQE